MPKLKPLGRQVVVVTGASSGIGLVTARMAARRGARLVLAARNAAALEELAAEIRARGGQAVAVPADVGREEDVARVAEAAVAAFGGFDISDVCRQLLSARRYHLRRACEGLQRMAVAQCRRQSC
jgi:NAD(P)-dependent dehydrogenase (short-subunit alcohol dehydrogenase family)